MEIEKFKQCMDEDEKNALEMRIKSLRSMNMYSNHEVEKIIFSEIEELGLRSIEYLGMIDKLIYTNN